MPQVKCIKCDRIGNLTIKKTKSHGTYYEYYYVQHYLKESNKIEWCYLGRYDSLPEDYRETLHKEKGIHNNTQNMIEPNNLKSSPVYGNVGGRSLAWLGHRLPKPTTRVQIPVTALKISVS
jgi:hypothetical protein